MCLTITPRRDHTVPYNNRKIRWKYALCNLQTKERTAPHAGMVYAPKGKWMVATNDFCNILYGNPSYNVGFHVLITRQSARDCSFNICGVGAERVIKVEVDGFIAAGMFGGHKTETWKRMRIL